MPRKVTGASAITPFEGRRVSLRGSGASTRSPSEGIINAEMHDEALRHLARILVAETLAKHKKKRDAKNAKMETTESDASLH